MNWCLVKDCVIFIANALEMWQFCPKQSKLLGLYDLQDLHDKEKLMNSALKFIVETS